MKPFSPEAIQQMEFCHELSELRSIFDVCKKTIQSDGTDDLLSTLDVLMSTNEKFQAFYKVENEYNVQLDELEGAVTVRTDEETLQRLSELYLIHSHYDVCASVLNSLSTDDLRSLSEVFSNAANRLYRLYDEQSTLFKNQEVT